MHDAEDDHDRRQRRFRSLYEAYYQPIQAYAVRRVAERADVADVVAEVFMTAWRRLADIPAPPADRLWLYGVARRVIAGQHRKTRRFRSLVARLQADHPATEQTSAPEPDPVYERLAVALARLGPADREALQLVLWERLSHAEAAKVLGCSVNAVAIRVHRAKARLRDALTLSDEADDPAGPSGPAVADRSGAHFPAPLKLNRS